MRMDLIQPFIGSLDAVLSEMMKAPAKIVDLTMEVEGYRRKGAAALVRGCSRLLRFQGVRDRRLRRCAE